MLACLTLTAGRALHAVTPVSMLLPHLALSDMQPDSAVYASDQLAS